MCWGNLVDMYGDGAGNCIGATFGQLLDRRLDESAWMDLSPITLRTALASALDDVSSSRRLRC